MRLAVVFGVFLAVAAALLALPRAGSDAAWPGDNGRIAYADDAGGGIWTMATDGSDRQQLTTSAQDFWPTWSADGMQIAYQSNDDAVIFALGDGGGEPDPYIWTMNGDGSNPQIITQGAEPSWHPSGNSLLFIRGGDIWTVDVNGSNEAQLTDEPGFFNYPVYSPDGQTIAATYEPPSVPGRQGAGVQGGPSRDVWLLSPDGDLATQITDTLAYNEGPPDWHPQGNFLVFRTDGGIATFEVGVSASPNVILSGDEFDPSFSPDGTKIVYADPGGGGGRVPAGGSLSVISTMDSDGSNPAAVPGGIPGYELNPDWQPAGVPTPSPTAQPSSTAMPTASPSPTASPTATPSAVPSETAEPSATATPTGTAGPTPVMADLVWADYQCDEEANPIDSLFTLRHDAGLSVNTNECPPMGIDIEVLSINVAGLGEGDGDPQVWGNADCDAEISPIDSLKILRYDAGLSVGQEQGCPPIGSGVTVQYAP